MKPCFKCGRTLPLREFYRHPVMADGHLGKCKDCAKRDVRENRAKRAEQYAEYERRRNSDVVRRVLCQRYQRRQHARDPMKNRARLKTRRAILSGALVRQPCEVCGNPKVDAHHVDYSRPLDVRWLCRRHHADAHKESAA